MKMGWDVRFDDILHKIPFVPRPIKSKVCDWLDKRLGVTEEEMKLVNAVKKDEEDWYTDYQRQMYRKNMGQ